MIVSSTGAPLCVRVVMPMICVVSGCANRSNRETDRSFFRVPKVVVHKGEKCRQLTEKRWETWLSNLSLRSGGAESLSARVCHGLFVLNQRTVPLASNTELGLFLRSAAVWTSGTQF